MLSNACFEVTRSLPNMVALHWLQLKPYIAAHRGFQGVFMSKIARDSTVIFKNNVAINMWTRTTVTQDWHSQVSVNLAKANI